ncbi:hypothetical protein HU200_007574 [Digitaria exilis]|uniref:Uncharacterized protein n=1 Tax=Digitaria exilis TaxID=1010633 RepID=A0A835FPI4_9POAL|nr:hypothetical protein HU200_007574 [Digitaria exilis]
MGNCAVTQHAVTSWADDGEWDDETSPAADAGTSGRKEAEHAEVTIRITRKQLQELMEKRAGGLHGLKSRRAAAAQLLADVMNAGQVYHHVNHCKAPHWKPALQSIPEAVES